jgi:hypothetical protein
LFLLHRMKNIDARAYIWFGLLAGLAGPNYWSSSWIRAEKTAERLLKSGFAWDEPLNVDLSWEEFQWMRQRFEGGGVFSGMPKLMPRLVSIEVVPGASCQFRIAGAQVDGDNKQIADTAIRDGLMRDAFDKIISLAQRARVELDIGNSSLSETYRFHSKLISESSLGDGKAVKSKRIKRQE